MSRYCYLCLKTKSSTNDVRLHRFPLNDAVRLEWIFACGLSTSDWLESTRICSRHFQASDYRNSRLLRLDAVPSIGVPKKKFKGKHFTGSRSDMEARSMVTESQEMPLMEVFKIEPVESDEEFQSYSEKKEFISMDDDKSKITKYPCIEMGYIDKNIKEEPPEKYFSDNKITISPEKLQQSELKIQPSSSDNEVPLIKEELPKNDSSDITSGHGKLQQPELKIEPASSDEEFLSESDPEDKQAEQKSVIDYRKFLEYICPECGLECGTVSKWKLHTETQHMSNKFAWLNLSSTEVIVNGESYYQCLDCDEKLSHRLAFRDLRDHHIKHLPHCDYLKCKKCGKRFHMNTSFYTHVKKVCGKAELPIRCDPNMKNIKILCPICKDSQPNTQQLFRHLIDKHDFENKMKSQSTRLNKFTISCTLCQKNVANKTIKQHMLLHESYKSFQCGLCGKYQTSRNTAVQHMRRNHSDHYEKLIKCQMCNATFSRKPLLWEHYRNTHKNFKCTVCGRKFLKRLGFIKHLKWTNHSSELNQFYETHSRNEHCEPAHTSNQSEIHEESLSNADDNPSTYMTVVKEEPQIQEFSIVPPATQADVNFASDIIKKENDDNDNMSDPEEALADYEDLTNQYDQQGSLINYKKFTWYVCPECGVECGPFSKWKSHTEEHHAYSLDDRVNWLNLKTKTNADGELRYECNDCYQIFSLATKFRELRVHRLKHLPYKFLKCRFCDLRFNATTSLYHHINAHHEKLSREYLMIKSSNPYIKYIEIYCPICQAKQKNLKDWWKHLKEKHDYENRIKSQVTQSQTCRMCNKELSKVYLRDHMLYHEANRSFKCTICLKKDTLQNKALSHVQYTHFRKKGKAK